VKEKLSEKAISDTVERVAGELSSFVVEDKLTADYLASRGRHLEAAQLYLEYTQDVDSAVHAVSSGADFAEAYRIVRCHQHPYPVPADGRLQSMVAKTWLKAPFGPEWTMPRRRCSRSLRRWRVS